MPYPSNPVAQPLARPSRSPDIPGKAILPGLYILATPIGNLGDISARALSLLQHADRVYAEDTRRTQILLTAHGISRRLASYHDHNGRKMRPKILQILAEKKSVILVSDAGTPLIGDPGLKLVREAIAAGIDVFPVPGASALLAALVASGLSSDRFLFAGFPPAKSGPRQRFFAELAPIQATLIFYEGPSRLADSLDDMASCFGQREAVLAREITKLHENFLRAPLPELARQISSNGTPPGELTILIGTTLSGCPDEKSQTRKIEALLRLANPNCPISERAAIIASETSQPRRDIYRRLLNEKQNAERR